MTTLGGDPSYQYDGNGNATGEPGVFTFDSYVSNLPRSANWLEEGYSSSFDYGPSQDRMRQVAAYPGGTETITYIGDLLEKSVVGSVTSWKHYIFAPSGRIALYTRKSGATPAVATYYFTRDHLGSIDSITDSAGAVQVRLSYTAHGLRRKEAGWSGAVSNADWTKIYAITHRGFTDHEMLDDIDVIHMNGRLYDPDSGRFVSADPFVSMPSNSQRLNRYSYALNNPLSYTDPSGFQNDPLTTVTVSGSSGCPQCYLGELGGAFTALRWFRDYGPPTATVEARSERDKTPRSKAKVIIECQGADGNFYPCGGDLPDPEKETHGGPVATFIWDNLQMGWFDCFFRSGSDFPCSNEKFVGETASLATIYIPAARITKRISLPSWRAIGIDMTHVLERHTVDGIYAEGRTTFPELMNRVGIERAIREAYRYGQKVAAQGDRVLMQGPFGPLKIEMWVNRVTKEIETAYPMTQ